jgi:nucleotide-binding universal stress UspA family protein
MYKHILIPTDGSEVAEKAVRGGLDFAREAGAQVTLFTAVPPYPVPTEGAALSRRLVSIADHEKKSEQLAHRILDEAAERGRAAGLTVDTQYACSDQPWRAIIDAAKRQGCDVIFMGSHGRKGLAGLFFGSETHEVLTHSTIPTLVYR